MREFEIIVYGSYGYTGKLIVKRLLSLKNRILLAGRDQRKLADQARETGLSYEVIDIDDSPGLDRLLARASLVVHCAGPFHATAKQMVNACLRAKTHYIDITGEYAVFEELANLDEAAKNSGITIMPGTGFDIVPTDCVALHLKNRLPDASHLELAFAMSGGGLSRGTARTMIDGLGCGGMIRKDGKLFPIALGSKTMDISFCSGVRSTMCIPWGDISTAWRTTGIPNIEVYTSVPSVAILGVRISNLFTGLLRRNGVKSFLRKWIDARIVGPSDEQRVLGKSYIWGRVKNASGAVVEARLKTQSGYAVTAEATSIIANKLLASESRPGYFTPASRFGERLIFEIEGTDWC